MRRGEGVWGGVRSGERWEGEEGLGRGGRVWGGVGGSGERWEGGGVRKSGESERSGEG